MLLFRAPLKISFAGGGRDMEQHCTWYGGMVVSAAIDKYLYAVVLRRILSLRASPVADQRCCWSSS